MIPKQSARPSQNFVNLDFMRSIAVLLVVLGHGLFYLGKTSISGWCGITGVCIFFVHTSLVLMWSLQRDEHIGRFYLRRVFRIYPLWLVVLALVVLLHLPTSPYFAPKFGYLVPHWHELVLNAALLFNVRYGARIVGASWTLPIEVQMYLFLPCLFFFARQLRNVWPLFVLDIFVMWYDYMTQPAMDSSLLMCVPYFLPGVMAYVLYRRGMPRQFPGWSFAILLLVMVSIDRKYGSFRHAWFFTLILGCALPWFREMTWGPVRVASHYIARYSYGVYLTHIAAIGVSVYLLRGHGLVVRIVTFLVLLTGLPVLFYHLVEEPMIRLGARLAKQIGHSRAPAVTESSLELEMAP